jgi:hypothetical protein
MAFTYSAKVQTANSAANPVTASISPGSTVELLVLCITVQGGTSRTGGTPTFDSVDMLYAGGASNTEGEVELWYQLNDDIGSGFSLVCSVPNSGTVSLTMNVSTYTLTAGNSAVLEEAWTATGVSTAPSVTASNTTAPGVIVDALHSGAGSLLGFTNNRTLLYSGDTGAEIYGCQYYINGFGGSPAMSYTTSSDDWAIVAAAFSEVTDPDIDTVDGVDMFNGHVASHDGVDAFEIESIDGVATNY